MLRRALNKEKVPGELLDQAGELTQLRWRDLKKIIRHLHTEDPNNCHDMYKIFLKAAEEGFYHEKGEGCEGIARLRCLVGIDQVTAEELLSNTIPPGNIIHAIERLTKIPAFLTLKYKQVILQFVSGCAQSQAAHHAEAQDTFVGMIDAASRADELSEEDAHIARYAYCLLLGPELVRQVLIEEGLSSDNATKLYSTVEERGLASSSVALMRHWKEIERDDIQDLISKGYMHSLSAAKTEYLARQLIAVYGVDRAHATSELENYHGDMEKASQACMEHMRLAKERLQMDPIIPTRDTQNAPDVSSNTRIICVLGVDEPVNTSNTASPSLGDGWMVSDFYLWMHVLEGIGKSQEWITTMTPDYLMDKYGREDTVTMEYVDDDDRSKRKPVQTKWKSGFIHGDPFEARKVVLDDVLLPQVRNKVNIGPSGVELREFFLSRLQDTMDQAAGSGDRVLIMVFAHGDFDEGGLGLGVQDDYKDGELLTASHMAPIFSGYPQVETTIFMNSCFSGHWVETTKFQGCQLKPVVLAAAEKEEESFGFAWSHSQRHAGGLFSSAAIAELMNEPPFLSPNEDTSREYHEMTTALVAEMHRLCLPVNIQAGYGSSPVFTDNESQEKFWQRTGYDLHRYLENYNRLLTIPASDPHPKRNRKTFEAEFVDGNDPEIVAWGQRHPGILDEDYPEATGGYGRTTRGLLSERNMRHLIKCYFRSKPGLQTVEHRMLMQSIRAYKDGFLGRDEQMRLRAVLSSRLQLNRTANIYVKFLGLYRLPDIEDWSLGQTSRELEPAVFKTFFGKVASSGLFQADVGSEGKRGPYYRKPAQYLASAMVLAGYDIWDVKAGIEKLLEAKNSERLTDIVTKSIGYSRSISTIRSWAQATRTKPSHKRPPLSDIDWK